MKRDQNSVKPIDDVAKRLTGARLHAARLQKRMPKLQDVARLMDVPGATLWGVEAGLRTPGAPILNRVRDVLGVSSDFVLGGAPLTGVELKVDELAQILLRPEFEKLDDSLRQILSKRLRKLRERAGYPHATAAARHFGWGRASYVNYEGYNTKMSLDRAIFFALDLGDDVDADIKEFLLGETSNSEQASSARISDPPDQEASPQDAVGGHAHDDASKPVASAIAVSTDSDPAVVADAPRRLQWLRSDRMGSSVQLAVLHHENGRLMPMSDPLYFPLAMLKGAVGELKGHFAIPLNDWQEVAVLDFADRSGRSMVFDGRQVRRMEAGEDVADIDPVHFVRQQKPVRLGRLKHVLSVHSMS
jgi:transcriptional regulator with XRE-family HTH domain